MSRNTRSQAPAHRAIVMMSLMLLIAGFTVQPAIANDYKDYYAPRNDALNILMKSMYIHHIESARMDIVNGNFDGAWHEAIFILEKVPNYPDALALLIDAGLALDRQAEVEWYLKRAIATNPSAGTPYFYYGAFYHRRKALDRAIELYKTALERNPRFATAYYNLGLVYLERNQLALANRYAQRAYALGFPFPGLKDQLNARGAWNPSAGD